MILSDIRTENYRKIVAIHQPNFLPWPGYFHKMIMADAFIYLDNVPYSKNSFQNRNKILVNGTPQWLTVPVLTRGVYRELTKDVQINNQMKWQKKHLSTLCFNYSKAEFFNWVYQQIEPVYVDSGDNLSEFCMKLNDCVRSILQITVPIFRASNMVDVSGATERLIALVKALNGNSYLSGTGGRKYLEENRFPEENVQLMYQRFDLLPYPQTRPGFVPGLSTLDLLFNLGPEAASWLRRRADE